MKVSIMAGKKDHIIVSGKTPSGAKILSVETVVPQQKNDHIAATLRK